MSEIVNMLPALFAGAVLGIVFFGGLWLTITTALHSKKPALVFVGSFIIRVAIVLAGFYYVGQNSWQKIVVCLAGFLIARTIITRITLKKSHSKITSIKEVHHET